MLVAPAVAAPLGETTGLGRAATVGHLAPPPGTVAALVEHDPAAAAIVRRAAAQPPVVHGEQQVHGGGGGPVRDLEVRDGADFEPGRAGGPGAGRYGSLTAPPGRPARGGRPPVLQRLQRGRGALRMLWDPGG